MLQRLSFKIKIVLLLSLVGFGMLATSTSLLIKERGRVDQANGLINSAYSLEGLSDIIHQVQKERALTVLHINKKLTKEELAEQRKKVDGVFEVIAKNEKLYSADALQMLKKLKTDLIQLRDQVDKGLLEAPTFVQSIAPIIDLGIKTQSYQAKIYHLDGLEARLLSISIFEKSKESMGKLRAAMTGVLSADIAIDALGLSNLEKNRGGVIINLESPALIISEKTSKGIQEILSSDDWKDVNSNYDNIFKKSSVGQYGIDPKINFQKITNTIDNIKKLIDEEIKSTEQLVTEAKNKAQTNFLFNLISILVLTIFTGCVSFWMIRDMVRSLNIASENLNDGAISLAKITDSLSATSQDLASSTSQQASALQQTTAAVEETTAMIAKNADNAKSSSEVSNVSKDAAEKGKQVVGDMITSIEEIAASNQQIMDQVEKSNQEISDIVKVISEIGEKTKVINDIVFQTKLLSFNASVEAARAGEQGKGFAVVAEEVGNLAQLSGKSAQEITNMLDESIAKVQDIVRRTQEQISKLVMVGKDKVDTGAATASKCGETLDDIALNVVRVSKLVDEIANASQEQSAGISEISKAMNELDSAAQKNHNLSEQTANNATELNQQVSKLRKIIQNVNQIISGKESKEDIAA